MPERPCKRKVTRAAVARAAPNMSVALIIRIAAIEECRAADIGFAFGGRHDDSSGFHSHSLVFYMLWSAKMTSSLVNSPGAAKDRAWRVGVYGTLQGTPARESPGSPLSHFLANGG